MKAHFERKMPNIETLRRATRRNEQERLGASAYTVIKEVELSDLKFRAFAEDLMEDQPWISKTDGGINQAGEFRCIRVRNSQMGERILVNSEGYDYPRYTAIEE